MRSPIGELTRLANKAPVSYTSRAAANQPLYRGGGAEAHMRAMGKVGTLFSIVDRLATSTSALEWDLYRKLKPGQQNQERQQVTAHAALDLWERPNPFFTQSLFVETFQQHYELVGEAIWLVARNPNFRSIPLELWPVSPTRIHPVPSTTEYLAGWIYISPDGERVPLRTDEVIQMRRPNPIDPYRGIGAVQTILADLEGVSLSAEWNRNFFYNSAEPGGIVEVPGILSEEDFNTLRTHWEEQHKGVANAHRVAILEAGKWISNKFTQRDMQFVELRNVSREVIREAFGISGFELGLVDDVNRATAESSKALFAERMTVPRANRIKDVLNSRFLPLFGTTGSGIEFDYASPVPDDREAADRERESKATAYKTYIEAHVDPDDAAEVCGLPKMRVVTPPPAPAAIPVEAARLDVPALPAPSARLRQSSGLGPRAAVDSDDDDMAGVREDLEEALETLLNDWEPILDAQIEQLVDQIGEAADAEDSEAFAALAIEPGESTQLLRMALGSMAQTAANRMARECAAQGVKVTPPRVDRELSNRMVAFGSELAEIATTVAQLVAADLAASAGREALRLFSPGVDGAQVASGVRAFLKGLKGALRRAQLGAALHRAANVGRRETLKVALKVRAGAKIFAVEENDDNTCTPCKNLDGYEFEDLAEADAIYGPGGYYACDGRERCRGTYRAVWD